MLLTPDSKLRAFFCSPLITVHMERWRQIDAILKSALELSAGERARFLDQACAGDAELREEVASLIARDEAGSFMENSAFADVTRLLAADESASLVGQLIGSHRILEKLRRRAEHSILRSVFFRRQPNDRRAPAACFLRGIREALDEGRRGKHASHRFSLRADALAMDDA